MNPEHVTDKASMKQIDLNRLSSPVGSAVDLLCTFSTSPGINEGFVKDILDVKSSVVAAIWHVASFAVFQASQAASTERGGGTARLNGPPNALATRHTYRFGAQFFNIYGIPSVEGKLSKDHSLFQLTSYQ